MALKHLVARARPCWLDGSVQLLIANPTDYSFPSGHTLSSVIGATILTKTDRRFGYRTYKNADTWMDALERLYTREVLPQIAAQGLSAAVYTQLSDVEDEVNGLLTFDRRVCKADAARMLEINRKLRF